MDQSNLNMWQQRWLYAVKDYDCEIMYCPVKANMVANALSCKVVCSLIRDIFLRMTATSHFMDSIKEAQVEGLKKENWKTEQIRGKISFFPSDSRELSTQCGTVWVPAAGETRHTILEEAHKSKKIHPDPRRCTEI